MGDLYTATRLTDAGRSESAFGLEPGGELALLSKLCEQQGPDT
jgi:hypothetical protein